MEMAVERVKPDAREAVMTTYEQIKQEGRQEGKSEAAAAILLRHLSSVLRHLPSVICHLFL
jgi:hypothetical protein